VMIVGGCLGLVFGTFVGAPMIVITVGLVLFILSTLSLFEIILFAIFELLFGMFS